MPYVIQTQDKPDSAQIRAQARPAHVEYLTKHKDKLLAAGALIDDDGTGGHGGVLIVDTDERAEAERFINEDPFTQGRAVRESDGHALAQGLFQQGKADLNVHARIGHSETVPRRGPRRCVGEAPPVPWS